MQARADTETDFGIATVAGLGVVREFHFRADAEFLVDERVADGKLYSFFDFLSTPGGYIGEDYLFCDRAREQGFEVWIDPTIKLAHVGVHEYEGCFGEDWLYPRMQEAQKIEEETV